MERIAYEIIIDILKFLTIPEIFRECISLNSEWRRAISSDHLLQYLVQRTYNLRSPPRISADQSYRILKSLRKEPKLLEFFGFISSGGVDENIMRFWCMNLFRSKGEAYCAHDDSENCNVGGVLLDSLVDPRTYFDSENSVRASIQRFVDGKELSAFEKISLRRTMELLGMNASQGHLISQLLASSEVVIPGLSEIRRYPGNDYILHHRIEISHSESSFFYAVVKNLKLARPADYTCPVKSLIVFISDAFVDVTDEQFSIFNNIRKYQDLKNLIINDQRVPDVVKHYTGVRGQYCEFSPSLELKIMPIVWVRFKENSINIPLSNVFTGKYLYVKLICPEDKREGRHQGINIDCKYVLPYGHIINLGTEYSDSKIS